MLFIKIVSHIKNHFNSRRHSNFFFIGLMWEIYKFTFDSLFGTNMQKIIPEVHGLFNDGDSTSILNGTNDLIADFF